MQDCNRHVEYMDKSNHMMNSYSISRHTWKWTEKLFFFHLLVWTILNSCILLTRCSSKLSHEDFRLSLVRDLLEEG